MLGHVLAHELGHHVLQHERRRRGERAARTVEHGARAEAIADELRGRLAWD
jgi:predicted Zn-dependent protease